MMSKTYDCDILLYSNAVSIKIASMVARVYELDIGIPGDRERAAILPYISCIYIISAARSQL